MRLCSWPRIAPDAELCVHREAFCSTGYSPILAFNVDDLQATLTRVLPLGAQMDGAVQYSARGKVGCCPPSWMHRPP